jgi:hypothetical protein
MAGSFVSEIVEADPIDEDSRRGLEHREETDPVVEVDRA